MFDVRGTTETLPAFWGRLALTPRYEPSPAPRRKAPARKSKSCRAYGGVVLDTFGALGAGMVKGAWACSGRGVAQSGVYKGAEAAAGSCVPARRRLLRSLAQQSRPDPHSLRQGRFHRLQVVEYC